MSIPIVYTFNLYYDCIIDMKLTSFSMESNQSLFHCIATGYPGVHVSWQSGLGHTLLQSIYNISLEVQDFNITLTSTLVVDDVTCREARGYVCVFHNGGSPAISRSAFR